MYDIGDEEFQAIKKVLERKKLYCYNSDNSTECDLFENEFSHYFNVSHSILLSSGTNALLVGLLALGIKKGDEVVVPVYIFVAIINAVLLAGAKPVVVKNDSLLGYDLHDLERKISKNTKAII